MKIAILGSHPASNNLAPFGDVTWEIWACSPQNYTLPRIDAWFELHSLDRKWMPGNEPYIRTLEKHDKHIDDLRADGLRVALLDDLVGYV